MTMAASYFLFFFLTCSTVVGSAVLSYFVVRGIFKLSKMLSHFFGGSYLFLLILLPSILFLASNVALAQKSTDQVIAQAVETFLYEGVVAFSNAGKVGLMFGVLAAFIILVTMLSRMKKGLVSPKEKPPFKTTTSEMERWTASHVAAVHEQVSVTSAKVDSLVESEKQQSHSIADILDRIGRIEARLFR